ncbi:MAG: HigA family addiction module antidote protein [Candidatus Lambdaproteobacteria bacterium]|nr:HigA family addiction module antidote protein [Candidatus Lambdaproteobacteria bacterium]
MKARSRVVPVPPGEMLEQEFMQPLGLSRAEAARRLGVPPNRITQIIKGRRAITPETALRLEALFGWPAVYWVQHQAEYDLERARRASGARIRKEVRPVRAHG